jgi:hypothetical protein
MRSVLALGIAAFTGFTAAQSAAQNNYPYTIDPNTVPESTRGIYALPAPLVCLAIISHVFRLLVLSEYGSMPSHLSPAAWRQLHEHRGKRLRL